MNFRRQNFEKQSKKSVFRHFLEKFDQKIAFFFGARSPLKISILGTEFGKILGTEVGFERKSMASSARKKIEYYYDETFQKIKVKC